MGRALTWLMGELWMFRWWRVLVSFCIVNGIASVWLFKKTPFGYVLKLRALEDGDFAKAAEIQRALSGDRGYGGGAPHRGP